MDNIWFFNGGSLLIDSYSRIIKTSTITSAVSNSINSPTPVGELKTDQYPIPAWHIDFLKQFTVFGQYLVTIPLTITLRCLQLFISLTTTIILWKTHITMIISISLTPKLRLTKWKHAMFLRIARQLNYRFWGKGKIKITGQLNLYRFSSLIKGFQYSSDELNHLSKQIIILWTCNFYIYKIAVF